MSANTHPRAGGVGPFWLAVLFSALALAAGLPLTAGATTIQQALTAAYHNNAQLAAQRAALNAAEDRVDTVQSGWKPRVNLTASAGRTHLDGHFSSAFAAFSQPGAPSVLPLTLQGSMVGLQVEQPLYEGGRTSAAINSAQSLVSAQDASVQNTEQQVFLAAARAYLDVLTDQAVLKLEQRNVNVLEEQLQSAQANFNNGEATRTDVAQSQARLAGARAQVIQARGALREDRASYRQVIGTPPQQLEVPAPVAGLPESRVQALQLAAQNYPVVAARYAARAANYNVDTVNSQFSPSVSLSGQYMHANDPQFGFAQLNTSAIMLNVNVPIYQGGALRSEKSRARHLADQRQQQLVDAQRMAAEQATRAWQAYMTARAVRKSIAAQIEAAQIAFKGVSSEHRVGERTQLDVLNAQQDLLSARVNLARAKRDMMIAAYALKASTGSLTVESLFPHMALGAPQQGAAPQ